MIYRDDERPVAGLANDQFGYQVRHDWRRDGIALQIDALKEGVGKWCLAGRHGNGTQFFVAIVSYQMGVELRRAIEEAMFAPADQRESMADHSSNLRDLVRDLKAVDGVYEMLDGTFVVNEIENASPVEGRGAAVQVEKRRAMRAVDVD